MSIVVTIDHIRRARELHGGYCPSGMRIWCERHGVSFRQLLQEGCPIEDVAHIKDAFLERVLDIARSDSQ